jgi:hypothetical protein
VKFGYFSLMEAQQLIWDAETNTGTSGTERNYNKKKTPSRGTAHFLSLTQYYWNEKRNVRRAGHDARRGFIMRKAYKILLGKRK